MPEGRRWAYEIKHDGFRFICRRDGDRVRVYSRSGKDWSDKVPAIVAALTGLPVRSTTLDGEGVVVDQRGLTDFARLRAALWARRLSGGVPLCLRTHRSRRRRHAPASLGNPSRNAGRALARGGHGHSTVWTAPGWQGKSSRRVAGRCGHAVADAVKPRGWDSLARFD
jgi:ATP dependent DNA ligase domain